MVAAAAGLAVAACLMAAPAPIVAGAVAAMPGDDASKALRHRTPITDEDMLTVISARSEALAYSGVLEWRRELATASLGGRGGRPPSSEALQRAATQTRQALFMAPAAPQDWLRLARIDLQYGDRQAAAEHLSMGLMTGGDMPRTRTMIVEVGFDLWPDLPGETKAQVLDALRHEWRGRGDRNRLMAQARAAGLIPLVRLALSGEKDFKPRFLASGT